MPDVWPPSLPTRLHTNGFTETPPAVVIRTEMEVGPAKVRRRTTAGVRRIRGMMWLTAAQRQTLDDFFVDTLAHGALAFEWQHPITGAAADFRFVAPPQYGHLGGGTYVAQFDLEILP